MQHFVQSLKKMEPIEKCEVNVDFIPIEESEEETPEDSDDFWITIDSKSLRKNSFLSNEQKLMSKDLSQILYTIIKTRFLIPISKITIDYNNILKGLTNSYFGKILITDDSSRALLSNIIDMKSFEKGSDRHLLRIQLKGMSCLKSSKEDII